jgi:ABC-type glycerol-3-phosphate transport system substrate-binding protein
MDGVETSYSDAITRLNQEITSNNPPDILLVYSGAIDLEAYAAKGVLEDFNKYLEKSENLKKEDLVDSVVRAFTIQDKLIGLPSKFGLQTVIGKTSVVGEKAGWTIEQLQALMDQYPEEKLLEGKTKSSILNLCLTFSIDSFIDWDKGTCHFDDDTFKGILELANRFQQDENRNEPSVASLNGAGSGIGSGSQLLEQAYLFGVTDYQLMLARAGEPITCIGYPTSDGSVGNGIQVSDGLFAIPAKSKHKDGAWAFLETVFQSGSDAFSMNLPVSKKELERVFTEASTPEYQYDQDGNPILGADGEKIKVMKGGFSVNGGEMIELYEATPEEIEGLKTLIDSAGKAPSVATEIGTIIYEEVQGYFEGQKTVDEVADIIQSRVQIYVSENK